LPAEETEPPPPRGHRSRANDILQCPRPHQAEVSLWEQFAVPLREAKQQRPPECARCLLGRTVVPRASGRPARRLIEATVPGPGPALMLPPTNSRQTRRGGTTGLPLDEPPRQMAASAIGGSEGEAGNEDSCSG
jgi:hypothetical protein